MEVKLYADAHHPEMLEEIHERLVGRDPRITESMVANMLNHFGWKHQDEIENLLDTLERMLTPQTPQR